MHCFRFIKYSKKTIAILLIVSFFVPYFSFTREASAQWIVSDPAHTAISAANLSNNVGLSVKEYVLDGVLRMVVQTVIKKLTASTVNWINSGFNGNPTFVQNPKQFFTSIGDETAAYVLSTTNLKGLCSPFQAKVRIALAKSYLSETSNVSYACTLDDVKNNFSNFMDDFSQGGWDAWLNITQNPQNNPYGAYSLVKSNMSSEISYLNQKYQKQIDVSGGFLNIERCKSGSAKYKKGSQETCTAQFDDCTQSGGENDECDYAYNQCMAGQVDTSGGSGSDCLYGDKETVTPGTVVNEQLQEALGTTWSGLEVADEINEIIGALLQQLLSQVTGGINGLIGASQSSGGGSTARDSITKMLLEDTEENKEILQDIGDNAGTDLTGDNTSNKDAPLITLRGSRTINLTVGEIYTDSGATAYDAVDGDISGKVSSSTNMIDTNTEGEYEIKYFVTNEAGVTATATRKIIIRKEANNSPITIELVDNEEMRIKYGELFEDPGANVIDRTESFLGKVYHIKGTGGTVNTNMTGTYHLYYSYSNNGYSSENLTRTVIVEY